MQLLISSLSIIIGFTGLVLSADRFVTGASTTARNLGVSPLIIGMTIVAFGTSAPEVFTSAVASLKGSPELSLGNVIGSNIANIGLVLGITLLISPLSIPTSLPKKEIPVLLGLTILCFFMFYDLKISPLDGLIFLMILGILFWVLLRDHLKKQNILQKSSIVSDEVTEYLSDLNTTKALLLMLAGLIFMLLSSNILVFGARSIASALGLSELVIGLTIVAIGTSLPELATSITSALKGHNDLAIGNIVGSNILNMLLVLPVPAFLSPFVFPSSVLWRDYMVMAGITIFLSLLVFCSNPGKKPLGRISGTVLLTGYLAYTGILLLAQS